MKKFFRIASVFLILASLIGCPSPEIGKNPGEEQKTGSIVGKVVYENGNVKDYSGIQVSLISTNGLMAVDYCESRGIATNARKVEDIKFTDSEGNYNFKDVPEGVYTICASSDNSTKKAVLTNVTVTAGRTVTASDLGLTATGSITGKITIDGSTDGVLGLDVFIAGTSFVAKVGSDGNYEISNIPAKKGYVLCVQKEKYTTTIKDNLEVKGNDTVKIDDVNLSSKDWEEGTVEQENPTFKWKGALESAPENPEIYWAYFNTKDGCSYIWNGSSWDLLAQDGEDGVFTGIYNTIENVIPENVTLARNPYAENYQVDIPLPYSEILPETGDKVTLKWEFTSDIDIKNLRVSLADCSELVNTWKDLTVDYITETVTKDEVISLEKTLELSSKPIGNLTLIIRYNVEDTDVEANFITSSSSITLQRGDKEASDNNIDTLSSQITCTAVEEGIKFDVYFLKEIISSENSKIIIKNIDDNINLIKTVTSLPNDNYSPITLIYPLVEKEKTYNFEVRVQNGNVNIGFKKFVITAIGGMGEYKVENANELEVTLSEDKVLSVTPQEFTDNSNVPILDYGFKYALYSNNDEAVSIWDGIWLYELNAAWNSSIGLDFDLKKILQISGWRDYSYLESALKGRRFGVRTVSAIKIAGYTYNDTVHFELNDYKETFFDWDEEEVSKVFVMYGYPYTDGTIHTFYFFDDIPGVEKYYVLGNDEGMSFVEKGTKNAIEVYGKFVENGQTIQVPVCIPNIPKDVFDTTLYSFTGEWHINDRSTILPHDVVNIITSTYYDTIDEFKYVILIPEFEQVKAIANFYDEDGKTLIESIECTKNNGSFVLTLPIPPAKENMVGYWVDEYGNEIRNQSVNLYEGNENKFYLKYKERVFSSDELYYLESNSLKNLYFDIEAGKSYKITWADLFDGSSDVLSLINEKGISSTELCDVKVFAFDDSGRYYIENGDSGLKSPVNITPSVSGKLTVEISPWSSNGQGYFALSVKEVDEGDKEPEAPTEIVLFEGDFSNYSVITTKTVLSENAGKTLALSIRNDSGEGRDGWGIGNIEFATDATNVYGSKTTAAIELKPTTFADNICILEFPVDDVLAAADGEIVTANVYNDCVLIKAVIK